LVSLNFYNYEPLLMKFLEMFPLVWVDTVSINRNDMCYNNFGAKLSPKIDFYLLHLFQIKNAEYAIKWRPNLFWTFFAQKCWQNIAGWPQCKKCDFNKLNKISQYWYQIVHILNIIPNLQNTLMSLDCTILMNYFSSIMS